MLNSLGVQTRWLNDDNDLEIVPPKELDLAHIDEEAARRTRSIIMFLGPLLHRADVFELPYAGGCNLGTRTVEPHMSALRPFGLEVKATDGSYHAQVNRAIEPQVPIVLTERGDTVTENALMAAALRPEHHRDPQRLVQLHGPGPLLLPAEARRRRRGHRHHDADRHRPRG